MIIDFSVQNFGSIKNKQTLSFEADKSTHLEDFYVVKPIEKLRLLKIGLIYGANASGKTTILKALDFLRKLTTIPLATKNLEFDYLPFKFDYVSSNMSTVLSINFIQNEIKYFYKVEFSTKAILQEELYYFAPKKTNIYKRTTDLDNQFTKLKFGSKSSIEKLTANALEANTLWNNTVIGGFQKINSDNKYLKEVSSWFLNYLQPIVLPNSNLDLNTSVHIIKKIISRENIINLLNKADFNINDFNIKTETQNIQNINELPEVFKIELSNQIERFKQTHNNIQFKGEMVNFKDIDFIHKINNISYSIPFKHQSQGTQRYYGLAGLLSILINKPCIFAIDELESSLHPDLYMHFLLTFLVNSKSSQLIATTHNRELFNEKDLFRNDAIWFTNKNELSETELYSLADFDTKVIRDTTNIFNAYKYGNLGAVPNLSDYYMDLENEK